MTVTPLSRGDWATLVALQELTELRRTEQVRRDFVANVSHELRTPLASLKAAIETLQEGALADPAVAQDFLARAASEVDRLVSLVEELLELSQLEAGVLPLSRRPVDAGELLQRAVERMRPQAERKGLRLLAHDAPGLPSLSADAERLERAILNLLDNAIKFTPAGGTVEASVAPCPEGVLITVRDTGPGIEREDLPRIFERFYKADRSRQSGGAGLGLAIARHIVEAHGGRIWAESQPEQGATFAFALPLADGARPPFVQKEA
jgi:two-component system phosphate regulon sensor histidine kinase PhoR